MLKTYQRGRRLMSTTTELADAIHDADRLACNAPTRWVLGNGDSLIVSVRDDGTGFARSRRTGQILGFRRSGKVVDHNGMVRCRVCAATDTGDKAGTLAFDFTPGHGWSDKVRQEVFQ